MLTWLARPDRFSGMLSSVACLCLFGCSLADMFVMSDEEDHPDDGNVTAAFCYC